MTSTVTKNKLLLMNASKDMADNFEMTDKLLSELSKVYNTLRTMFLENKLIVIKNCKLPLTLSIGVVFNSIGYAVRFVYPNFDGYEELRGSCLYIFIDADHANFSDKDLVADIISKSRRGVKYIFIANEDIYKIPFVKNASILELED